MSNWKPIETAPKDRAILVRGGTWYSDDDWDNKGFPLTTSTIAEWRTDGWHVGNGYAHDVEHWAKPTKWHELPAGGESGHVHSTQEDYEHFLAYSGIEHSPAIQYAYFHGADVGMDRPDGVGYTRAPEVIPGTNAALAALGISTST